MYEIQFLLLVNKQGQTRLSRYYNTNIAESLHNKQLLEGSIVRKCLNRNDNIHTNYIVYNHNNNNNNSNNNIIVVYRRYASLYFIIGVQDINSIHNNNNITTNNNSMNNSEAISSNSNNNNNVDNNNHIQQPVTYINLLCIYELIHMIVETLDKYYSNVCELDIMFNIHDTYFIIDEIIINGYICETSKKHILKPIKLIDSTLT